MYNKGGGVLISGVVCTLVYVKLAGTMHTVYISGVGSMGAPFAGAPVNIPSEVMWFTVHVVQLQLDLHTKMQ